MTANQKQSRPRVPTAHPFTAIRMTLESDQSFEETHNKILAALNCTDYVPGEFMREAGPVVMQKDWGAFEEYLNKKAGPSGNMCVSPFRLVPLLSVMGGEVARLSEAAT